jgi:hypothetical protein
LTCDDKNTLAYALKCCKHFEDIKKDIDSWGLREEISNSEKSNRSEISTGSIIENDCISRADAIHAVSEAFERAFVEHEDIANKLIGKLPAVTPQEPKTGHWKYGYAFADGNYCKCSECKEIIKCIYPMHYCPNCGAKMVEPHESEEK